MPVLGHLEDIEEFRIYAFPVGDFKAYILAIGSNIGEARVALNVSFIALDVNCCVTL